jgi:FkbM family methyltransferase
VGWQLPALRVIGAYLRHSPDHPGRWRLIDPAVRLAPALRTVTRPMVIRVREGFVMQVDGSSQTGRMLYATGEYESETSRLVERLLGPGDTMIDVGANIGYFTILGARTVGGRGRVVAFEPMPQVRARLEQNIALNQLTNVAVRNEALSDASGPITFYAGPADDTGLASLRPLSGSSEVAVTRARFDDLLSPSDRVALVKIDVEGAEMAAIRGMSQCLRRDSPHVILEVTDDYLRVMGTSADALAAHMLGLGYSMYRISHGPLIPIRAANDLRKSPPQFNALFTKADVA